MCLKGFVQAMCRAGTPLFVFFCSFKLGHVKTLGMSKSGPAPALWSFETLPPECPLVADTSLLNPVTVAIFPLTDAGQERCL